MASDSPLLNEAPTTIDGVDPHAAMEKLHANIHKRHSDTRVLQETKKVRLNPQAPNGTMSFDGQPASVT